MQNYNAYQQMDINTASPMQLVIMLYDEAIKSLDKAERAFSIEDPSRIEEIGNHLLHAQDCITELAISLDMEQGGEISHNLHRLYDFMINHLSEANVQKKEKNVQDVRNILKELREAWQEVANNEQAQAPQATLQQNANKHGRIHISG